MVYSDNGYYGSPPPNSDYQVETPPQDFDQWYKAISPLANYGKSITSALASVPSTIYQGLDLAGRNVALPSLQKTEELYNTDWSKQPFISTGENGELTGRLPALAETVAPYLLGAAPAGSASAGVRLPSGHEGGYHGTPHVFDPHPENPLGAFRNEAIGSGEGAQAYGYGHYVAGEHGVAKSYKPSYQQITFEGQEINSSGVRGLSSPLSREGGSVISRVGISQDLSELDKPAKIVSDLTSLKADPAQWESVGKEVQDIVNRDLPKYQAEAKWVEENRHKFGENSGSLYHVEIKPPEEDLLHWDKPLSEQTEKVKDNLSKFLGEDISKETITGEDLYKHISRNMGPGGRFTRNDQWASQELDKAGIPGIKYRDAGSRNLPDIEFLSKKLAGAEEEFKAIKDGPTYEGKENDILEYESILNKQRAEFERAKNPTHNYVIFDPKNLNVIHRENHLGKVI